MRLVHSDSPLPVRWCGHPESRGLLVERDLRVGTSRLKAKLLVFDQRKSLRRFWKRALGKSDLGPHCPGAVNSLVRYVENYHTGTLQSRQIIADPRYFCVIGVVFPDAYNMEVMAHEAVHAGLSYAKRIKRTPWDEHISRTDEEAVAYPAGIIACHLNRALSALHEKAKRR